MHCSDKKMRVFSTDSTKPPLTFEHGGTVYSVAFSSDSTAAYDLFVPGFIGDGAKQATLISDIGMVVN